MSEPHASTPLPCPFCGGLEHVTLGDRNYQGGVPLTKWVVACDGCGAEVLGMDWIEEDLGAPGFPTRAEAIAAWNLRGGKPGGRLDG